MITCNSCFIYNLLRCKDFIKATPSKKQQKATGIEFAATIGTGHEPLPYAPESLGLSVEALACGEDD